MDRRALWPDFRAGWILHDDGDLIVVDKPAGVSSQAADPERPDDAVTRLRAHLGGAYLGVHQRLDRDTSGILVFARRKEANASLARSEGVPFGLAIWLGFHEVALPLLHATPPLPELPLSEQINECITHCAYGFSVERTRRSLRPLLNPF